MRLSKLLMTDTKKLINKIKKENMNYELSYSEYFYKNGEYLLKEYEIYKLHTDELKIPMQLFMMDFKKIFEEEELKYFNKKGIKQYSLLSRIDINSSSSMFEESWSFFKIFSKCNQVRYTIIMNAKTKTFQYNANVPKSWKQIENKHYNNWFEENIISRLDLINKDTVISKENIIILCQKIINNVYEISHELSSNIINKLEIKGKNKTYTEYVLKNPELYKKEFNFMEDELFLVSLSKDIKKTSKIPLEFEVKNNLLNMEANFKRYNSISGNGYDINHVLKINSINIYKVNDDIYLNDKLFNKFKYNEIIQYISNYINNKLIINENNQEEFNHYYDITFINPIREYLEKIHPNNNFEFVIPKDIKPVNLIKQIMPIIIRYENSIVFNNVINAKDFSIYYSQDGKKRLILETINIELEKTILNSKIKKNDIIIKKNRI